MCSLQAQSYPDRESTDQLVWISAFWDSALQARQMGHRLATATLPPSLPGAPRSGFPPRCAMAVRATNAPGASPRWARRSAPAEEK